MHITTRRKTPNKALIIACWRKICKRLKCIELKSCMLVGTWNLHLPLNIDIDSRYLSQNGKDNMISSSFPLFWVKICCSTDFFFLLFFGQILILHMIRSSKKRFEISPIFQCTAITKSVLSVLQPINLIYWVSKQLWEA